jgi:hypothetical protein
VLQPRLVLALHGRMRLAFERQLHRFPLEAAGRPVVRSSKQRPERANQPHVPVEVVEDQRDRLLAVRHVGGRRFIELGKESGEKLVEQQVAHLLRKRDLFIRRSIVGAHARGHGKAPAQDKSTQGNGVQHTMLVSHDHSF